MDSPVVLRAQTEDECDEDKTERSFLFRRQDENLSPVAFRSHGERRLT